MDLAAAQAVAVFMARAAIQAVAVFMTRALKVIKVVIISNLAKEISSSSSNPDFRVTQSN